jgi:hypothetical protein
MFVPNRKHLRTCSAWYMGSFTLLYVDFRTSQEAHASMVCYGDSFTFLYVDEFRTSQEAHASTACYGHSSYKLDITEYYRKYFTTKTGSSCFPCSHISPLFSGCSSPFFKNPSLATPAGKCTQFLCGRSVLKKLWKYVGMWQTVVVVLKFSLFSFPPFLQGTISSSHSPPLRRSILINARFP